MDKSNHEEKYDDKIWTGFLAALVTLAGMLVGAIGGAAAMLLLAPQSGKKTRAQVRRKGRLLREQTAETIKEGLAQARAKAQDVTTSMHEQAEELQQRG